MTVIERFEQFKTFEENRQFQEKIVQENKRLLVEVADSFEEGGQDVPENVAKKLVQAVQEAEKELFKTVSDALEEKQELEKILKDAVPDMKIRNVLFMKYIQGMALKDISKEIGYSYDYTLELAMNGRKLLNRM